jgi:hypothetical protein
MTGNWKAVLGVILVFVLGCLAGVLASSVYFAHRASVFLQRGAAAYIEVAERRVTRGLNLDENQKEQIHEVFMANLAERKHLQAQIQPQIQALNFQTVREIKSLLRPDQMEAFHRNLTEFHRRFGRPPQNAPALDPTDTPSVLTNSFAPAPPATNGT